MDPQLSLVQFLYEWRTHAGGIPIGQSPSPISIIPKRPDGKVGLELDSHEFEWMASRAAVPVDCVVRVRDVRSVVSVCRFNSIPAARPDCQLALVMNSHDDDRNQSFGAIRFWETRRFQIVSSSSVTYPPQCLL